MQGIATPARPDTPQERVPTPSTPTPATPTASEPSALQSFAQLPRQTAQPDLPATSSAAPAAPSAMRQQANHTEKEVQVPNTVGLSSQQNPSDPKASDGLGSSQQKASTAPAAANKGSKSRLSASAPTFTFGSFGPDALSLPQQQASALPAASSNHATSSKPSQTAPGPSQLAPEPSQTAAGPSQIASGFDQNAAAASQPSSGRTPSAQQGSATPFDTPAAQSMAPIPQPEHVSAASQASSRVNSQPDRPRSAYAGEAETANSSHSSEESVHNTLLDTLQPPIIHLSAQALSSKHSSACVQSFKRLPHYLSM